MHKKSCRSVFNILVHFNHPISSNKHPGSYLKFKLKGGRGGGGAYQETILAEAHKVIYKVEIKKIGFPRIQTV